MDASIIVPLTGDADRALRTLQALAGLPDLPRHEVVLVDDATTDLQPLLARVAGDVTLVRRPHAGGVAAAVRSGLERASGAVHVVLAEGALLHPDALPALIRALQDERLAAVSSAARHPVAAQALAWRAAAAPAPAALLPDAPDDGLVAALCCAFAVRGPVVAVPDAIAAPPLPADDVPRARSVPGAAIELSVVIPTLDAAGDRVRACLRALQRNTDVPHELIVLDNGAPPQGFTDPVNAALRAARGAYLVVCNDDVLVDPGWWGPLRAALSDPEDPAAVVFPRTVDGAMREDFAAWCFAFGRDTLERFAVAPGEFLHPELRVWYQDTDLLTRLRAAGRPPRLVAASTIRHGLSATVASSDPALRAWIDAQIGRDRARFEQLHGTGVAGAAS